jgi:lactobin A/cerein 7B family class IIb bacteriocin
MPYDSGSYVVTDVRGLTDDELDLVSGGIEPVTTTVVVVIVAVAVVACVAVFAIGALAGYVANR